MGRAEGLLFFSQPKFIDFFSVFFCNIVNSLELQRLVGQSINQLTENYLATIDSFSDSKHDD